MTDLPADPILEGFQRHAVQTSVVCLMSRTRGVWDAHGRPAGGGLYPIRPLAKIWGAPGRPTLPDRPHLQGREF